MSSADLILLPLLFETFPIAFISPIQVFLKVGLRTRSLKLIIGLNFQIVKSPMIRCNSRLMNLFLNQMTNSSWMKILSPKSILILSFIQSTRVYQILFSFKSSWTNSFCQTFIKVYPFSSTVIYFFAYLKIFIGKLKLNNLK